MAAPDLEAAYDALITKAFGGDINDAQRSEMRVAFLAGAGVAHRVYRQLFKGLLTAKKPEQFESISDALTEVVISFEGQTKLKVRHEDN